MNFEIVIGGVLILLGLFHILRPQRVSEIVKNVYKHNPFLKKEEQRVIRPKFVMIFGITWVMIGLFVIFLGK